MSDPSIMEQVRARYAAVAGSGLSGEHDGVRAVAEAFGYTPDELRAIPAGANMGLSCGNPTAIASLRPGETVVDLGSGGGLDVFLAARQVGPRGKAIGIDMTPEMVELARANAERGPGGPPIANVEFHLATIDNIPLPNASVDCVISNCVINLAPDKPAVFREIARILKPGGRLAVSDIALKKPLPPEVGQDLLAYVGCVAGALPVDEYVTGLKAAGFSAVQVVDTKKDLNAYAQVERQGSCCSPAPAASTACCSPKADAEPMAAGCCTPAPSGSSACCTPATTGLHRGLAELLHTYDVNDYAASVQVYAVKA